MFLSQIFTSFRSRIVMASILVQCIVLGALVFNTTRIWNEMTVRSTQVRITELSRLLNAAFAKPIAQGELVHVSELLDHIRTTEGVDYLVLIDARGETIATRGWDIARPLPQAATLQLGQSLPLLVHAQAPLVLAGGQIGMVHFGVSTEILRDGLERLMWQDAVTILLGLAMTLLLMSVVGVALTRHLYRLIDSGEKVATGAYEKLPVPVGGGEVAQLTERFNEMAQMIKQRVLDLSASEERFHVIADYTYGVELWLNPEGELLWINASITRLTGYSVEECKLLAKFPLALAMPDERENFANTIKSALQNRTTVQDFEFRALRRDGSTFWAAAAWQPLFDKKGEYLGLRASIRDNSELKDERMALRKAVIELRQLQLSGQTYLARAETEKARLMALLSAMRFGVLFVDNDNRIVFHNPAFCDLWNIPLNSLLTGRSMGQVLQQADNRPAISDVLNSHLDERVAMEEHMEFSSLTMNDGRIITQHCHNVPGAQGLANGRMWIYEDVTQQRNLAEHMIRLAERDALTGLHNRHRFQQELERLVSDADRRQTAIGLLFFDLDEFKHVNDTFGHGVGDLLLQRIAQEIGGQVRRHEVLARLGGDEFAILVPDCNEFELSRLAERVVSCIAQIQFSVGSQVLRPATSVGVAIFPQHGDNIDELVAHADAAMYQAKAAGKSTWRIYRPEANQSHNVIVRMSWKDRIIEALANDGFELHYQGIYHTQDKSLAHLEALIRMKDPQAPNGLIMPNHFIGHAEATGKIVEVDRWVIRRVIALLGSNAQIPSIALNISGRSFDEPDLPDFIHRTLAQHRVAPSRLLVELTETAAVSDMRDAQRFIDALRATGCTVCLDDFGSGFASFAYLKQLKANVLKIDGLFIRDLPNDHDSQVFVRGMVAMARDMGKTTIAEFVENQQIYDMLAEIGVDQVQGYYLDKPARDHASLA